MKAFLRKSLYSWRYFSLGEETYKKCIEGAFAGNLVGLQQAGIVIFVLSVCFSLFPLIVEKEPAKLGIYYCTAVIAAFVYFIARNKYKQNRLVSHSFIYTLIIIFYVNVILFGAACDIWSNPYELSGLIAGILVVAPLIFVISPIALLSLSTGALCLFVISTIIVKEPKLWMVDTANIVVGYFCGQVFNWLLNKHKLTAVSTISGRGERFYALSNMASVFLTQENDSFEDVMSAGIKPIAKVVNVNRVAVYWLLDQTNRFGQIYLWANGNSIPLEEKLTTLPDIPPVRRCLEILKKGECVHHRISDVDKDQAEFLNIYGIKTIFFMPIFMREEFKGVVTLSNTNEDKYFDNDRLDIMRTAAHLCAGAVVRNKIENEKNRLTEEVEAALIKAQESNRAKSEFLSRMSHEMRTPINTVMGMTQIMKITGNLQKKEQLDEIEAASRELMKLVDDVLNVSGMDFGTFKLVDSNFDFHTMIHDTLQMASYNAAGKRQMFTYDIDASIPALLIGDEKRLKQVIVSLLGNAIKFTPEKGKIHLSVRVIENSETEQSMQSNITLQFEVSDNGIGISEENQKQIFDLFYQVDSSLTREHVGMGLGLSLSKRIIERMGGAFVIKSEIGKGSVFTFTCKLKTHFLEKRITADSSEEPPRDFSGKCILVVDDLSFNRGIIRNILEATGVQIIEAADGKEAVSLYYEASNYIDLILMDIMMPIMNGFEASQKIRESGLPGADRVPIIGLTAMTKKEDMKKAKNVGMVANIGKLAESSMLIETLKQYL